MNINEMNGEIPGGTKQVQFGEQIIPYATTYGKRKTPTLIEQDRRIYSVQ